jgi:hypothetical protein
MLLEPVENIIRKSSHTSFIGPWFHLLGEWGRGGGAAFLFFGVMDSSAWVSISISVILQGSSRDEKRLGLVCFMEQFGDKICCRSDLDEYFTAFWFSSGAL